MRIRVMLLLIVGLLTFVTNVQGDTLADQILQVSNLKAGLCVHLDCKQGRLAAELHEKRKFLIHGLASDGVSETPARAYLKSRGLYGRITIDRGSLSRLPYADNIVNLLVASRIANSWKRGLTLREVMRVLTPNGIAYLGQREGLTADKLKARLAAAGIKDYRIIQENGVWARIQKPKPTGMDEWTHYNHDAGGNRVSKDTLAGPPTRVRWLAGPDWPTLADGPAAALSAGGRLFYCFDEAPERRPKQAWPFLVARDAYNGLLLWKKPAPGFIGLAFVAREDRVYAVTKPKGPLVCLDAATGKRIATYKEASYPEWAVVYQDSLLTSAGGRYAKQLRCLDPQTGKLRWQYPRRIMPTGQLPNVVVAGNHVYFLDWRQRLLGSLDRTTGKVRWQRDISKTLGEFKDRIGLCSFENGTLMVGEGSRGKGIHAFSAQDGAHLWTHSYRLVVSGRPQRHKGSSYDGGFFINGLYWNHVGRPRNANGSGPGALAWEGLDPATGRVKKRYEYPKEVVVADSCHRAQATVRYFMGGHTRFVSTETGRFMPRARGVHNSCGLGMLPANGLMYTWSQYTRSYLRGNMGLAAGPTLKPEHSHRLEKGPAFGTAIQPNAAGAEWVCQGRDAARSNRTTTDMPAKLNRVWQTKIGGELTPLTVAGGKVFLARVNAHRVIALDERTGNVAWDRTVGGRVCTPPTYYGGLCLVGSSDGWAYCLRVTDGKLVWRFRAAPVEQRVVVRERLESSWPIEGGVLVVAGVAYFAAGRHGTLNGGVYLYAVKPATGEPVWQNNVTESPVLGLLAGKDEAVGLGEKLAFSTETGEKISRLDLPAAAYAPGLLDVTYLIGSTERRIQAKVSMDARAIVTAGKTVVVAGRATDVKPTLQWIQARNPYLIARMPEARDNSSPSRLWTFARTDGKLKQTVVLDAPPLFDGMATLNGRLYLATTDGCIQCLGNE